MRAWNLGLTAATLALGGGAAVTLAVADDDGGDWLAGTSGQAGVAGVNGANGVDGSPGANGLQGASGASGAPGIGGASGLPGAPGESGSDGALGAAGENGLVGAGGWSGGAGTAGVPGLDGLIGLPGAPGEPGADGALGAVGADGFVGAGGLPGANGVGGGDGIAGLTGAVDANGLDGGAGLSGSNGSDGVGGASGANGADGALGFAGADGANGLAGVAGVDGLSGEAGVAGEGGASGSNGVAGLNGQRGVDGRDGRDGRDGFVRRRPVTTAYAPPLTASEDTCSGATSGGAQAFGIGFSVGTTWHDDNCRRIKNARELAALGYRRAAVQLLCVDDEVREAMRAAGTPCPIDEQPAVFTPIVEPPPQLTETPIRYDIFFDFDSARLKSESEPALQNMLAALQADPAANVEIEGHTDWTGTDAYNLGLSQRRAQSVVDWLAAHGVARERLTAVGKGEAEPVDSNDTRTGRAHNRRVEISRR